MLSNVKISRRLITEVLAVAGIALLTGIILTAVRWSEPSAVKQSLAEANELIGLKQYKKAVETLEDILSHNPNPRSLREYLRLHLAVAVKTGSYGTLLDASKKVISRAGDKPTYWRYRVLAESRGGLHQAAVVHAEQYLPVRAYKAVRTEVYIAAGIPPDPKAVPDTFTDPAALLKSDSPADFKKAARKYNSTALSAEAARLTARYNDTVEAFRFLDAETIRGYPELALFLAYDAHEFERALDILSDGPLTADDPELLILKADIYILNGLYRSAGEVYKRFISLYPEYESGVYHNLSRIENDPKTALDILDKGLSCFPDSRDLILSKISLLLAHGREGEARDMLASYISEKPGDGYARFLWEYVNAESRVPDVHASRMWLYLDSDSAFRGTIAAYTAWFLGAGGRFDDLQLLLDRTKLEYGDAPWHNTYQGIMHAMNGSYGNAADSFQKAVKHERNPENLYNAAVAYSAEGDIDTSLSLLTDALISAEQGMTTAEHTSAIGTELARILAQKGNRREALEQLRDAVEADPGNLEARRLEKIILEGKSIQ